MAMLSADLKKQHGDAKSMRGLPKAKKLSMAGHDKKVGFRHPKQAYLDAQVKKHCSINFAFNLLIFGQMIKKIHRCDILDCKCNWGLLYEGKMINVRHDMSK